MEVINIDSKGRIAKEFSFKIRWSVTSSKFTINSSSVKVTSHAKVIRETAGSISGYENMKYYVELSRILSKKLTFTAGGTSTGTISGLRSGSQYTVSISTGETLPASFYLEGSGQIEEM